jgi:hypothetical protein
MVLPTRLFFVEKELSSGGVFDVFDCYLIIKHNPAFDGLKGNS